MPSELQQLKRAVESLARTIQSRFTQPEFLAGCEIQDITDINQYATANGWIEVDCAHHGRQRVRYKGFPASVQVGDELDIFYFPDRKVFEIKGAGGTTSTGIDAVKVSKVWQPDGSATVLTGDNSGDTTISGNVILSGASKAVKGSGSNTPDLGTATASEKIGDVHLADGKDIYPNGDTAGLFQRNVNHWQSPTDHFNSFSGWTWATYTGFVTPANISAALSPSLVRIANTATEGAGRAFAYQGSYGSDVRARCAVGALDTRTGIRMDDGTNNNYVELFLEPSGGLMKLRYRYAIGGTPTGPTDLWGGGTFPSQFVLLRLVRSGDNVQLLYAINTSIEVFLTIATITGWTPSRSGIYHEHTSGLFTSNRASQFDWYAQ